jgi:uncharacterized membrane protein
MMMSSTLGERTLVIGLLLAASISVPTAHAQDAAVRQACSGDFHSVCSGVTPGGGRIKQCMVDNFDKLSDGCKAAMKAKQMAPENK